MQAVGLRQKQQGTEKGARKTLPCCSHTLSLPNLADQLSRSMLLSDNLSVNTSCIHCRSAEVNAAHFISEYLAGDVLGKPGPVPVEIGNVIVEELHYLGLEANIKRKFT